MIIKHYMRTYMCSLWPGGMSSPRALLTTSRCLSVYDCRPGGCQSRASVSMFFLAITDYTQILRRSTDSMFVLRPNSSLLILRLRHWLINSSKCNKHLDGVVSMFHYHRVAPIERWWFRITDSGLTIHGLFWSDHLACRTLDVPSWFRLPHTYTGSSIYNVYIINFR